MKTIKFLTAITAIGVAVALYSCSKGADGTNGTNGSPGTPGNANVKDWTTASPAWSLNSNSIWIGDIYPPALTSSFSGAVEVYFSQDGGNSWTAIPNTYYNSSGSNYYWSYTVITNTSAIELDWTYNGIGGGNDPNSVYSPNTLSFNIVCIAAQTIKQHPNTNWKDYSQVQAILNEQNTNKN